MFALGTGGADTVLDFQTGVDRLQIKGAALGDRDLLIEKTAAVKGPGGFARQAELVIVAGDIPGAVTAAKAAAAIGLAGGPCAKGDARLFAVDNGADSAVYLFRSQDADARVEAAELALIGTLHGAAHTAAADYALA